MSEFIGSRISLISKSDIKYVGTLHEINSETSTVALENVRSYGTEGRRGNPDEELPPSDQTYDYIVFRGSDVKDLTIVEGPKENKPPPPQVPNDPAILGAARPHQGAPGAPPQQQPPQQQQQPQQQPQQGFQQPSNQQQWRGPQAPPFPPYGYPPGPQQNARFAPPGGPHGFPNSGVPPPPGYGMQYGPPPGWFPPPGQGFPQGPPASFPPQPIGPPGQYGQQKTPAPVEAPAGRPNDMPSAPQEAAQPTQPPAPEPTQSTSAPPPPVESKPDVAAATAPAQPQSKPAPTGPKNNRVALPLASPNVRALQAKAGNAPPTQPPAAPANAQNATQAAAAAVAAAMAKLGAQPAGGDQSVDNLAKKVGEMRTDDRTRHPRQPGAGAFAAGHRGGRGGRRPSTRETTKPVEVPTTDFDFEGSNAKFNKQDLVKEAIATGSPLPEDEMKSPLDGANGAAITSQTSAASTAQEPDVVIPSTTYNKSSSFFDNISSELKDRQVAQDEGKRMGGMEFRTEERKKNFETFGQGSVDNGYRGGFRGGRGRGRGGFGRGGRGYAGGNARGGYMPRGGAASTNGGRGGSVAAQSG